ncbi:unnamed protein product, partial [Meganyctiphanes norvegica]
MTTIGTQQNILKYHGSRSISSSNPPVLKTHSAEFRRKRTQEEQKNGEDVAFNEGNINERSTLNEEEVNKFRAMAESWWDPHGDCKPLHSLNKLRVSLIRNNLIQSGIVNPAFVNGPQPLTGLNILDVGCGGGILCEPLARLGAQVTGVDAAQENISVAEIHAQRDHRVLKNVNYICGTIEEHSVSVGSMQYDAVVASEVLEHVDQPEVFIDSCASLIKPGGSLFLTTINKTYTSWIGAIAIAEYALHLLPPGTHNWEKFIPRQDLLFMVEKSQCHPKSVQGMAYNPVNNQWCWISNISVNYAVHAIKEK